MPAFHDLDLAVDPSSQPVWRTSVSTEMENALGTQAKGAGESNEFGHAASCGELTPITGRPALGAPSRLGDGGKSVPADPSGCRRR